jgi:hypothetical protein
MTSQYEKALAENYRRILKHGRTNNIKKLTIISLPIFFHIEGVVV